jgi:hypothetical protein
MALTDLKCKKATCPADKVAKDFFHGNGLCLRVTETGKKTWIAQLQFENKRNKMSHETLVFISSSNRTNILLTQLI